jgi:hypothetical protein
MRQSTRTCRTAEAGPVLAVPSALSASFALSGVDFVCPQRLHRLPHGCRKLSPAAHRPLGSRSRRNRLVMRQSTRTCRTAEAGPVLAVPSALSASSALSGVDFVCPQRLHRRPDGCRKLSPSAHRPLGSRSRRNRLVMRQSTRTCRTAEAGPALAVPSALSASSALSGFDFVFPPRLCVSAVIRN